ncbi:TIGR02391 family protein [Ktedonobacter robiniae]|uniref:Conserved hypothetical protein CHP02391 domain-containing protein n=1 Tax=Ktedonobacter robiniae TaxID=2778365 RepID=A0ABQ3V3U4_9CHLR|nr:TIGR02391 family protein [Ktedonobacter robiniae]GHO59232.1 hypothetical protein KSB_77070 [Ktedonobacter robiniae]
MLQLEEIIADFKNNHSALIEEIAINREKMMLACEMIKDSWSGSWFGYHSKLYYGNFSKPPRDERFSIEWGGIYTFSPEWRERSSKEVKTKLRQLVGDNFNVDEFEKKVRELVNDVEDFQTQIELFATATPTSSSQLVLSELKKIEPIELFIKSLKPQNLITRDMEAVSQGIITPVIIYYEALALQAETAVTSARKSLKLVERFVNLPKFQAYASTISGSKLLDANLLLLHPEIQNKCQNLVESGAYAEAVEKSFKVVRDKLRTLTGYEKGAEAFGKGKIHIKGAAAPNVDNDFNSAVKFLTMAIDMFRNEKSHTSNAKIHDSQQAYEYLCLSSLTMRLLDQAEVAP